MTTQIPTSNDLVSGQPTGQGLPDISSLAAMANAFFQALPGAELPGAEPNIVLPVPAGELRPQSGRSAGTPALPPHIESAIQSAPSGADYYFAQQPDAYHHVTPESGFGNRVQPETFGMPGDDALRQLLSDDSRFADSGASLAHARQQPQTPGDYHAPAPDSVDRVSAQALGLPGEHELQQLLSAEFQLTQTKSLTEKSAPAPSFYFLEQGVPIATGKQPEASTYPEPINDRGPAQAFDVHAIRRDFPILSERVNGRPLVWFDNAATTHKPTAVIERVSYFYEHENSNIHRAAHELAARATDAYEGARQKVARFLGAKSTDEIIFVRGATEAINLLANTYGRQHIGEGDEIVVSQLEHHANIVPWYMLAKSVGAKIRVIPVDDTGQILLDEYRKLLNSRTKLVAVTQVSNALGTVTPIKDIVDMAHAMGVRVLVDGAQAVSHMKVNVQTLDADFYVFSGHKVFGPTGIGVIYGKAELLNTLSPWQGGGNMIADVTFDRVIFQDPPNRFEAGTGNIADAVGLGAAIDYVERIGMDRIARYENDLVVYATRGLSAIPGVRLIGTAADKASVVSFVLAGYKTEEVGTELNREGIAVRSGHHCAQPILRRFGVETTVRPSFAFYNTCEEIDLLVSVVGRLARSR